MKGIRGLIVAVGLGLAAAILNYFYLAAEAQKIKRIAFIGIQSHAVMRGERLMEDNFTKIEIPADAAGDLKDFACLWDEVPSVKGRVTWRTLKEGSLLLRSDIETPIKELELAKGESIVWLPLGPQSFVPSLVRPGDMVSFIVPRSPTPAVVRPVGVEDGSDTAPKLEDLGGVQPLGHGSACETIGKFQILSVGNRLGDPELMRKEKIPQLQEHMLGIRVKSSDTREKALADKLLERLQATNYRQVQVIKHGAE